MGRMLVMPSRAESLPYVVLEAAAAGVPVVATRVGGVSEIFGDEADRLIPPEDVAALVAALTAALADPALIQNASQRIRARVRAEFSLSAMVDGGLAAYREALMLRKLAQFT
jgi:glycosyltransferase involved in cell wall biosynthesis